MSGDSVSGWTFEEFNNQRISIPIQPAGESNPSSFRDLFTVFMDASLICFFGGGGSFLVTKNEKKLPENCQYP